MSHTWPVIWFVGEGGHHKPTCRGGNFNVKAPKSETNFISD